MNELVITKEEIDRFLQQLAQRGRSESTLQRYRHDMETLYAWLPEDKILNRERMERWKDPADSAQPHPSDAGPGL